MQKFDFTYLRYKNTSGKFIIIKNNFVIALTIDRLESNV
jgi:hypothetical protein